MNAVRIGNFIHQSTRADAKDKRRSDSYSNPVFTPHQTPFRLAVRRVRPIAKPTGARLNLALVTGLLAPAQPHRASHGGAAIFGPPTFLMFEPNFDAEAND